MKFFSKVLLGLASIAATFLPLTAGAQGTADRSPNDIAKPYFWVASGLSGGEFASSTAACQAAHDALHLTTTFHLNTGGYSSDQCMFNTTDPAWTGTYSYTSAGVLNTSFSNVNRVSYCAPGSGYQPAANAYGWHNWSGPAPVGSPLAILPTPYDSVAYYYVGFAIQNCTNNPAPSNNTCDLFIPGSRWYTHSIGAVAVTNAIIDSFKIPKSVADQYAAWNPNWPSTCSDPAYPGDCVATLSYSQSATLQCSLPSDVKIIEEDRLNCEVCQPKF